MSFFTNISTYLEYNLPKHTVYTSLHKTDKRSVQKTLRTQNLFNDLIAWTAIAKLPNRMSYDQMQ